MSAWLGHPDDEPSARFGNWADDFNTYTEACEYYGCDTPAQVAAEMEARDAEDNILSQDEMEARGGPLVYYPAYRLDHPGFAWDVSLLDDGMPF